MKTELTAKEISAITENSPDLIVRFDRQLRRTFVNTAYIKAMGRPKEELLGREIATAAKDGSGTATAEEIATLKASLERVFDTRRPLDFELTWPLTTGRRTLAVHFEPDFDTGAALTSILAISRDITEGMEHGAALRSSEASKTAILDSALDSIVTMDHEGCITEFNPAAERTFGYRRDEVMGQRLADVIIPPSLREQHRRGFARYLAKAEARVLWGRIEMPAVRADGSEFPVELTITRIPLEGPPSFTGYLRDITGRKRAEEAMRESQQLLNLVLATLPVGVAVLDRAGDFVLTNAASKRIWGDTIVSGSERWAQSKGFWHDSGKRIAPENWASARALSEGQTSLNELIDIETYDGQKKTIQNSSAPIRDAEGLIVGAVIVNEDVTERMRAGEALKDSHVQLRALSARLQSVREEEATRIAREIHDDLGQKLTGLKLDLQRAERKIEELENSPTVNSILDSIVSATELTDGITASIQEIAANLRPEMLDKLGLGAALRYESRRFQQRTGIFSEACLPAAEPNLPTELSNTLFRIFQECLTNIARHAHATKIETKLTLDNGWVNLCVQDNGQGITEAEIAKPESLGLLGMKERASILGGEITFEHNPNAQGTVVTVRIPQLGESALCAC